MGPGNIEEPGGGRPRGLHDGLDDGVDAHADSPLVRALRAPGTAAELADESRWVAAFSASRTPGRGLLLLRRAGVGSVAAAASALLLTGGVAVAAFTQQLPPRVQAFAHDKLGAVGVPPALPIATGPTTGPTGPDLPVVAPSPSADSTGSAGPTTGPSTLPSPSATLSGTVGQTPGPSDGASTGAGPILPTPPTATSTPTGDPTSGPTSTSPPPDTTAPSTTAVLQVSTRRVPFGSATQLRGVVVRDGSVAAAAPVELWSRPLRGRWRLVGTASTDTSGTATFGTAALSRTTAFQLRVPDAAGTAPATRSRPRRVAVRPLLSLAADGATVTVHTVGGRGGDTVHVMRRGTDGRLVRIGTTVLDQNGDARYVVRRAPGRVRIVVRVLRTPVHAAVRRAIRVRVPGETPPPTPTTTPSPTPTAAPGTTPRSP